MAHHGSAAQSRQAAAQLIKAGRGMSIRLNINIADTGVPVRVVDGRYGRIAFFETDVGAIGRSLNLYGEWAEQELSFMHQFVEPGATVLDVGAYIGTHTIAFSRFVGPTGTVVAFEPMPRSFAFLQQNVVDNDLTNVLLNNAALGGRSGAVEVQDLDLNSPASYGSTSLRNWSEENSTPSEGRASIAGSQLVPVVTIDKLALKECSLIKIDVEGMEACVIKGAAETLQRLGPVIYAECNTVADGLRTVEQLQSVGYRVWLHLVDAFCPHNFFQSKQDIFEGAREAAIVAVPGTKIGLLESIQPRTCEMLLPFKAADDLVLGLLNKPQFADEVLRKTAAAGRGGMRYLDDLLALKSANKRLTADADRAKGAVFEVRERIEAVATDLYNQMGVLRDQGNGADNAVSGLSARMDAYAETLHHTLEEERCKREELSTQIDTRAETLRRALEEERCRREELSTQIDARAETLRRALEEERCRREEMLLSLHEESQALRDGLLDNERRLQLVRIESADRAAMLGAVMHQAHHARELTTEAHMLASEATSLRDRAITMRQQMADCVDALRQELDMRQADLAAIRQSTSWRITGPLRTIVTRIRGPK
jgi:FkbM family methyltransferase